MKPFTSVSRAIAHSACLALLMVVACSASAQEAPQEPESGTSPAVENPKAQMIADELFNSCQSEFLGSMPQWIRDDAGKDASPELIEEMVEVGREGMCECFVSVVRKQPDDRVGGSLMDDLEPQFKSCMAGAMKPRMARICTEAQRMPKDETAPDCACFAAAVGAMDDQALGAGANDLFDVLNSTQEIPATAGALGEAARGCAKSQ